MKPFVPKNLPLKDLNWISYIPLIGDARDRLSKFDGLLQGIPNPQVLLSPLTTQEAVVSSKIEGTQATLEEVLRYDADPQQVGENISEIMEVVNYRKAMYYAMDKIEEVSLSEKLIKEIHSILLEGVRSNTKIIGKYRDWQVYIGKQGTTINEAEFIPPEPQLITGLMENLEEYIHSSEIDPLVQLAIIHAQFEMIHPFGDGNGRLGRIIMPLFLYYKKVLSTPMFYLSAYFEKHRNSYYRNLNNISQNNLWDEWILYFLEAVKEQSEINIEKAKSIIKLYNLKKEDIKSITRSQYSVNILDFIFSYPFFSSTQFSSKAGIKPTYANDILKKLTDGKLITLWKKGKGNRPSVYVFEDLIEITG